MSPSASPQASGQTQALADFAFASDTHVVDMSRPLAWLSPEEMDIDLSDPVQRRFGDYELIEKIGQGGMGVVYRARQHGLERDVAFKLLAAGPWASEEFVERFRREARSAARMQHPNIVEIHEFGHREGLNYFSMRLIEGQSLAQHLHDHGPMAPLDAARLLRTLAEAMDYAHRLGVLHLDLKPANVLLGANGVPLIADFGLARRIDAGHDGGAEEVSGSPSYMAPEQATLASFPLSAATDIHGLGAILYETLTRRPPFMGSDTQSTLERVVAEVPTSPQALRKDVPADLAAICMKCLAKRPADRYASARELAEDLGRFIDGRAVSVRPLNLGQRLLRWRRREPRLAGALATALAALVLGAAATSWQWHAAVAERDAATAARDRAQIASEIGAWLFDYHGRDRGTDLVTWLRQRLPGDAVRQADALAGFQAALDRTASPDSSSGYAVKTAIVTIVGADYRRAVIRALQSSSAPRREVWSAILAFDDSHDAAGRERLKTYLQRATAAQPDDVFTWQVAAVYCPLVDGKVQCLFPQAAAQLVRIDPGNMYHWLLLAIASDDPREQRRAMHEAAARERFDDHLRADFNAYFDALHAAAEPVPALLSRAAGLKEGDLPPVENLAYIEASNSPYTGWMKIIHLCLPADLGTLDPQLRADCIAVGARMARSSESAILTRMIGVALVRPLARGTPIAAQAQQARRDYEYAMDATARIGAARLANYPESRMLHDQKTQGELVAWQNRIAWFGVPPRPPANWQPANAGSLLSARERIDDTAAIDDRARAMLATSQSAAAALLEKNLPAARGYFVGTNSWRLARYLLHLGHAHLGQRRFTDANANLQEAWKIVEPFGPGSQDTRAVLRALVDLQTAWDAAEPGKGHDLARDTWQAKLDAFEAKP